MCLNLNCYSRFHWCVVDPSYYVDCMERKEKKEKKTYHPSWTRCSSDKEQLVEEEDDELKEVLDLRKIAVQLLQQEQQNRFVCPQTLSSSFRASSIHSTKENLCTDRMWNPHAHFPWNMHVGDSRWTILWSCLLWRILLQCETNISVFFHLWCNLNLTAVLHVLSACFFICRRPPLWTSSLPISSVGSRRRSLICRAESLIHRRRVTGRAHRCTKRFYLFHKQFVTAVRGDVLTITNTVHKEYAVCFFGIISLSFFLSAGSSVTLEALAANPGRRRRQLEGIHLHP